jgi:hypothetical protein
MQSGHACMSACAGMGVPASVDWPAGRRGGARSPALSHTKRVHAAKQSCTDACMPHGTAHGYACVMSGSYTGPAGARPAGIMHGKHARLFLCLWLVVYYQKKSARVLQRNTTHRKLDSMLSLAWIFPTHMSTCHESDESHTRCREHDSID